MKNIQIYESFRQTRITLTSRQGRTIAFDVVNGTIANIDNQSGVNFPYVNNSPYRRNIETWACNHGFKWREGNGPDRDPCPEKKVFGIKTSDIPKGHELRRIYPGKFR
jgi:hypothetical protein